MGSDVVESTSNPTSSLANVVHRSERQYTGRESLTKVMKAYLQSSLSKNITTSQCACLWTTSFFRRRLGLDRVREGLIVAQALSIHDALGRLIPKQRCALSCTLGVGNCCGWLYGCMEVAGCEEDVG